MNHQTFQCNIREQRLGRTDSLESTKLASTTYEREDAKSVFE